MQAIAAQVFDLPVVIPSPGEYVARGAAVQAAWARSGKRPEWPVAVDAAPAPDFHPEIQQNYLRAGSYIDPATEPELVNAFASTRQRNNASTQRFVAENARLDLVPVAGDISTEETVAAVVDAYRAP